MSFIRRFLSNLFLSVVVEGSECSFYGRVFRGGKVIKTLNAKFSDIDPQNIDQKVLDYINTQERSYSDVYVALFFTDESQGALPTVREDEFKNFNINAKGLKILTMKDGWSVFANEQAVQKARDTFGEGSVDLVYSPIALLYYELSKRIISAKTTLYIYNHEKSFALAIFKDKKMRLATFVKTEESTPQASDEANFSFDEEDITDIDNLIVKEESESSSLDDFKSLDELLNNDNFKEFEDLGYDINMPASASVEKSVTIFGRDMSLFSYIKAAIAEFYQNPLYGGDFVEQVIVFDNAKTSATFLQYLQTELLVETSVYPVSTLELMNDLMVEEIGI